MQRIRFEGVWTVLLAAMVTSSGCPSGDTCDPENPGCPEGFECQPFVDGKFRCARPLFVRGQVVDLADDAPIEGARVQAADVNGAAVGTSGVTNPEGFYTLTVPAVRNEEGAPVDGDFTLRVQAAGYQEFPTVVRPALPIDPSTALLEDPDWVLENSLTTVKLIALTEDTSNNGSISGTVLAGKNAGALIVAEGAGGSVTIFSDSDGDYVNFNVPAGSYTVQGYLASVQLNAANADVAAGEETTDVDLTESIRPLNTVSGHVQIVNAPGGSLTSVILAVKSTFVENAGRGVPPGLRVGDITGAFTIDNVPDGEYVVLAAFENDDLVRDPDQSIGGTMTVEITLPDPSDGNSLVLADGFKITEALAVVSPGADVPEEVDTLTPTFEWADDSSEDGYEIRMFDQFGTLVFEGEVPGVSGSATVTHDYAGPALEAGQFYQFRVKSFRDAQGGRTYISATEDLRGVFFVAAS